MQEEGICAISEQWALLESYFVPTVVVTASCELRATNEAARTLFGELAVPGVHIGSMIRDELQSAVTRALLAPRGAPARGPAVWLSSTRQHATTWLSRSPDGAHVVCTIVPEPPSRGSNTEPAWCVELSGAALETVFRTTPAALALLDLDARQLLDVSERYCELLGVQRSASVGDFPSEGAGWAPPTRVDDLLERVSAHRSTVGLELTLHTGSRRKLECIVDAEQLQLGGRRLALLCLTDVTSKKRAERASALLETQVRQSQKLEALGTLAGGIAHDFNNILGAIVARSALVIADCEAPELVKLHVRQINTATQRAAALVRRILTFSRQQAQDRAIVQLDVVVQEALDLVRPTLPTSTSIELRIEPGLPAIRADATQIHQAIINLCNNAYQAMHGKVGSISISLHPVEVDETMIVRVPELRCGSYACLSITDTGDGMSPEVLERIFDPFYTTKPPGMGTGLGLAMVHGVVREHEGAVVVDSIPGVGTSFVLYFPESSLTQDGAAQRLVSITPGRNEHVLLVDDEQLLCKSIAALLRKIGYRVSACTDPREALELLRRSPHDVDVLLTDLTMPELTGLELSKQAQALRPDLPVIVTSGYTASWGRDAATDSALEFSPKPLGLAELSQSVRRALDNRSRLRTHEEDD